MPVVYARSNYGAKSVQLAAPGTGILATSPCDFYTGQLYQLVTGTSMAAPFVSGAAALALAASGGTLTNVQLAALLISTSRPVPGLKGRVVANGIIDLNRLVLAALAHGAAARAAAV